MPVDHVIVPVGLEIKSQRALLPDGTEATIVSILVAASPTENYVIQLSEKDSNALANALQGRVVQTPNGAVPSPLIVASGNA